MKEIFDLMREQFGKIIGEVNSPADIVWNNAVKMCIGKIDESKAMWEASEAELRANVIDEFAEAIMVKATELSEKVVFDGRLVGDALSLDCVSDMVVEIASNLKGEKE